MGSLILPDVNVLVSAFREDHVHHEAAKGYLKGLYEAGTVLMLSDVVLSGLVRVVTHPRIFTTPSDIEVVFAFVEDLKEFPGALRVLPGPDHWKIFTALCREAKVTGAMVTDAYLGALALEHGCVVATFDQDFKRFAGVRTVMPK
jgi:toxin-antitoxin system PIN domain toxin